ncbi:SubName: Full=Uncharacterized protein {ECO:0000313/EMBL:CCA77718.1} [Serendipita indica DSM 11827]|nr:SubName: Full=Uncharacterized protein {ECO:0000313/EMBL:CCA77718.1} [Serendipita indica DSM 11827]
MPPRAIPSEKQIVVGRFMDILAAAGIYLHPQNGHRYIKWNAFPDHVWDRGVVVRLPREIVFDSPAQTVEERISMNLRSPWTDENVEVMRKALDNNLVSVHPRPHGSNIIFEAFDDAGNVTTIPRFGKRERHRRRGMNVRDDVSSHNASGDDSSADNSDYSSSDDPEDSMQPLRREISRALKRLCRDCNIPWSGLDSTWLQLPILLARRKRCMSGLPSICAPNIVNDEVDPNCIPSKWSDSQIQKFLDASKAEKLRLVRRDPNRMILFEIEQEDGTMQESTLEFSPAWLQRFTQAPIIMSDRHLNRQRREAKQLEKAQAISATAVVTKGRGWVIVEESTGEEEEETKERSDDPRQQRKQLRVEVSTGVMRRIAEFDINEDGSEVPWALIPQALAQKNKYITGFHPGALPKIKDDKVVFQASHPSVWSGDVISHMKTVLDSGSMRILPREPGRIVLFETVDAAGVLADTTLGYSEDWLALNIPDPSLAQKKEAALERQRQREERAVAAAIKLKESHRKKEKPEKPEKSGIMLSEVPIRRTARHEESARRRRDSELGMARAQAMAKQMFEAGTLSANSAASRAAQRPLSPPQSSYRSGTSTPYSEVSSSYGYQYPPHSPMHYSTTPQARPAMHPRHAFKGKQRSLPNSDELASSTTPQSRWPPLGYPKPDATNFNMTTFLLAFNRFFERHALTSVAIPIPWLGLPYLLAERRQYLRGVPYVCLPFITEDQVDDRSNPARWTQEMATAMNWAMVTSTLRIATRETGRRVLFEVIGPDGRRADSTLGFSDEWVDHHLPDTTNRYGRGATTRESKSSTILSLKRIRSDSPDLMDVEDDGTGVREAKRTRMNGTRSTLSPMDASGDASNQQFVMNYQKSAGSSTSGSGTSVREDISPSTSLGLDRLVPSSLPQPLRGGRVFLRVGTMESSMNTDTSPVLEDTWEWIPPAGNSIGLRKSTVWNPTQARWRLVSEERTLQNLDFGKKDAKVEMPDQTEGVIFKHFAVEYVEERGQWEMVPLTKQQTYPWVIRWDEEYARWEWTMD